MFAEITLPPPPPHSTYRIRRPRVNLESFQSRNNALPTTLFASELRMPSSASMSRLNCSLPSTAFNSDEPMPSIETPTAIRPALMSSNSEPLFIGGLAVPAAPLPPRTPPAQTNMTTPEIKRSKWEMHRAASVCSHHSDSSLSSSETFATRPTSFDGSATSPDCDNQDPFSPPLHVVKIIPDTPTRQTKRLRPQFSVAKDNVAWSIEMDNHLFNVYQMYLADPTVTPFKTVPGSIPPTGVCHRVARRAKETWPRASRIDVPIVGRYKVRNLLNVRRMARDKTPEPENFLQTDEARVPWPTESSTRKRLKQLCREKFTISAHYQRLRESRSPSPFTDQFTRRPSSRMGRAASPALQEPKETSSWTTRELGISLVANDATAPLARVMAEDTPTLAQRSEDWFRAPVNAPEPMIVSPPPVLAESAPIPEPAKLAPAAAKIPRLASPFNYSTWNGPSNRNPHRRNISHSQFETIHATGSRLLSPFRPGQDMSFNNHKRRAAHNLEDELSPTGSNIGNQSSAMNVDQNVNMSGMRLPLPEDMKQELVFSGAGDISQRRIRLRNRGASLGAHVSGMDRIGRLFTPPPALPSDAPPVPALPAFLAELLPTANTATNTLSVPDIDPAQKRLGSPFELDPNKRSLRNRSPRHAPSMSDPFISTSQFSTAPFASGISNFHQHNNSIGGISERLALFGDLHRHDGTPQQGTGRYE